MKHKHYNEIMAWAEGAAIETLNGGVWVREVYPRWTDIQSYRIAHRIVKMYGAVNFSGDTSRLYASLGNMMYSIGNSREWNRLAYTFVDGNLVEAVVLPKPEEKM